MTIDLVKQISGETFKTIIIVGGPVLLVSMGVGLLVSLIQSITQINDTAVSFVPKVLAVFFAIFALLPWMARVLISFTTNLIEHIPEYIKS